MKILIVDNYDSFTYNLFHLLKEAGATTLIVKYPDHIDSATWQQCDAIVYSPGPGNYYDNTALMQLTNKVILHKPIMGICLGFQALAAHWGAKFVPAPRIAHGESSTLNIVEPRASYFNGLPQNPKIGRYHSWVMDKTSVPSCLQITAYDNEGNIQTFHHKELPLIGLQFHPESIITSMGLHMITNWMTYIYSQKFCQ